MKKLIVYAISAISFLIGIGSIAQNTKHVVLVTIDGFRPDFYLESQWSTPNLHTMKDSGSYAYGVNSVFPSMTYPSHTTIVTGVQPEEHGVYFNSLPLPDSLYWRFDQVKTETIWKAARKKGMKTASLMWPVSAGIPNDFNLSDIGSKGTTIMKQYAAPVGIYDTIRQKLFAGASNIEIGKDHNVARIAAWVIKNEQPNIMTIHLFSVDHAEHITGRHGKMVYDAIADADSSIGIIKNAIKKAGIEQNTLFIVTGDHGFYDVDRVLMPNILLRQAGLIDTNRLDHSEAYFNTVGGAAFLFVKNNNTATIEKVKTIFTQLPADQKKYFRIISKKEMHAIGADPEAMLALSGLENTAFGSETKGDFVKQGKGGAHGFYPDSRNIQTGFLMEGPGVQKQFEIKSMNLRDITAIIAQYLGLDMPSIKGRVPSKAIHFN